MIYRRGMLAGMLAAPAIISRAHAQSSFDWKQCTGQKLEIMLSKNPRADMLQAHEKEFEALTGIKIGSEQMPEQQQRQKMAIEFASGHPSFDVAHLSLHVSKRFVGKGHFMEDLRPYVTNPSLTAPDYDFADLIPAAVKIATQADGRMDSLPLESDIWLVYWNKALFAERGLPFPTTMNEMLSTARALTDKSKGIYGFVGRGLKNANVPVWTNLLLGQDQETVNADATKLLTDSDRAIAAAQMYKDIQRDCAPPGVVGFNWNECQTSFSQGKIGMWMDGVGFTPPLVDPAKSRIADHVGFGVMPAGPKGHFASVFTDGIGIAAASRNKNAAWLYCQWATSKAMMKDMVVRGAGAPPRSSAYADPALLKSSSFGPDWFAAIQATQKIARPGLPEIVPVTEFRDVFGIALTNMIGGADPATELKAATAAFQPVLDKSNQA